MWVRIFTQMIIIYNMKYIITESQDKKLVKNLIDRLKSNGWKKTAKLIGGEKSLMRLLDIHSPEEYLELFNDMDEVQSKKNSEITIFGYGPKKIMLLDTRQWLDPEIQIDSDTIWFPLKNYFGVSYLDLQKILKQWLKDSFGIEGLKPIPVGLSHYILD